MSKDNIIAELKRAENIVIAAHVNPDADAIGSSLGLAMALGKLGKRPRVVLEAYNSKYDVIPGKEFIYNGSLDIPMDVFVCLDCSSLARLGEAAELFLKAPVTLCVDHHLSSDKFANYNFVDSTASSTCELMYEIIKELTPPDADIASAIYAGLVTDTGGFRHGCTKQSTMIIAGQLISLGIPFTNIYNELMYRHSEAEAGIFCKALSNMKVEYPVAFSSVSKAEMDAYGATSQDLDGIAEYLLNIRGVALSVFFYEKHVGEVKASFRSKEVNVSEIAGQFGGGGHKNASGCTIFDSLDRAREAVLKALKV